LCSRSPSACIVSTAVIQPFYFLSFRLFGAVLLTRFSRLRSTPQAPGPFFASLSVCHLVSFFLHSCLAACIMSRLLIPISLSRHTLPFAISILVLIRCLFPLRIIVVPFPFIRSYCFSCSPSNLMSLMSSLYTYMTLTLLASGTVEACFISAGYGSSRSFGRFLLYTRCCPSFYMNFRSPPFFTFGP